MRSTGVNGLIIVCLAAFGASLGARIHWVDPASTLRRDTQRLAGEFLRSPGADLVKIGTFELHHAWADFLWLGMVQEMGRGQGSTEAAFDRVEHWSEIATDLDPKYLTIYDAAAILLVFYGRRVEPADRLLLKGREAIPDRFSIPFMLAFNAYFMRNDPKEASEFMLEAARMPNAPPFAAALAGQMRAQAGDRQGAVAMLKRMLQDAPEGGMRDAIEYRLKAVLSEPVLQQFDQACLRYVEDKKTHPPDGETLRAAGYIDLPPLDAFGEAIVFGDEKDKCLSRTKEIKVREAESRSAVAAFREQVRPRPAGGTVNESASGLKWRIFEPGVGASAQPGETVKYAYKLWVDRQLVEEATLSTEVGATPPKSIAGMEEALLMMPLGAVYELTIPPDLAYGDEGALPSIAPNATLLFEVQVLQIGDRTLNQSGG